MQATDPIPTDLLPLVPAVEKATGRRYALPTIIRWTVKPRKGIILQNWVICGRRFTTVAAVLEYVHRMTEASTPTLVKPCRTQRQREQAIARAERTIANLSKK